MTTIDGASAPPPTLAYFVHGRGRGHAARARHAVPALHAAGYRLAVFAGGDALGWLPADPTPTAIPSILPGAAGPARWARRVAHDRRALRMAGARLVITDGDGPCLLAARSLGLPSIALGHGLLFGHAHLPALPRLARWREALNAASAGALADRRVAVHFLPATASDTRTRIARPDFEPDLVPQPPQDHALCYFRDGDGHGLLQALWPHWSGLGVRRVEVYAPTESAAAMRALPAPPGTMVRLHPPDPVAFRSALPAARAVVGSAGSNLLSECVHLGRPLLCQYAMDDTEQRLNALMAERAGVAVAHRRGVDPEASAARFCARLRGPGFTRVSLTAQLPAVSAALGAAVADLLPRA